MKAAAAYLNSKAGGGGVAGRKVVVDFYDSRLNPTEARNATISACENDLAMVGTAALFLTSVDDIVELQGPGRPGAGLPDLSSVATGVPETCAATSFPVFGLHDRLRHGHAEPADLLRQPGRGQVAALAKHKGGLHGPMIVSNDTKDANRGGRSSALTAQQAGIKADQGTAVPSRVVTRRARTRRVSSR